MAIEDSKPDYGHVVVSPRTKEWFERPDGRDPLKNGDGGGNSGDMERRLALVEDSVKELRRDVGDIKVDLATLKERVAHLPGKGFIVSVSLTSLVLIAAFITFADKIQALVR